MRVWLMRHAQAANHQFFHGFESDVDLSPLGRRQAEAAAQALSDTLRPEFIASSGMRRARQTAEPIAQACGLPLHVVPELHERKVGTLSGQPAEGEWGVWPDTLRAWIGGETSAANEGAESFDQIAERIVPAFRALVKEAAGRSTLLVVHGIVIRTLILTLTGRPVAEWHGLGHVKNCSVSELTRDPSGAWSVGEIGRVPEAVSGLA